MNTPTSASSQDHLDLEEFSLRQHVERLAREVALLGHRGRDARSTQHDLENYQRRLVLHRENKVYESRRRARRLRMQQRSQL